MLPTVEAYHTFLWPTALSGESPRLATAAIFTCVLHKSAGCGDPPPPRTTLHGADACPIGGHAVKERVVFQSDVTGGLHGRAVGTNTSSDATSKEKP